MPSASPAMISANQDGTGTQPTSHPRSPRRKPKAEQSEKSRRPRLVEKTGAEKREEEMRGMTPELRARLERERRARAAEERIRRMQAGAGL
ncbi:hypothetical protein ACJ72_02019 [Emergomyces africanus]|uniref:Uncharacterized protein n=1 Tax=Emergomyces africanus TaxID=1955775 RepID=A0A1B7P3N1_9EURO|nr:hypothetical protein ACJ72_02019 [Emergomyces africanus]